MELDQLWDVSDRARKRTRLSPEDSALVQKTLPDLLSAFPRKDLALGIMRSHFHLGYPKGTHCCVGCTLAVYPVLVLNAVRYFNCRELAQDVREIIATKAWRFAKPVNAKLLSWSLGEDQG